MTGWIKLHRKLRENPIYMNSHAVHVWIECLLRASHHRKEFYLGREKIMLNEGQFIMGRSEFAKSIGMSGSTVWFWLNQFKVDSMVDIQTIHGKGSIISVLRWSDYQVLDSIVDTGKTQNEHRMNTNNNIKKEKNDKKENNSLPDFEIFWRKYNYKIGKPDCIDYWTGKKRLKNGKQMNDEMRKKCLSVIDKYVANTHKDDTYPSRKHPKTYLYNSCWDDEIIGENTGQQPVKKFNHK